MSIPKVSRAAVLVEHKKPSVITDINIPPLEPKGILAKVLLAGTCGTDVHQRDGTLSIGTPLPIIQGHETLGEIVEIGHDRKTDFIGEPIKPGDRIMWAHAYCGTCYGCKVLKKPFMCFDRMMYGYAKPEQLCGGFSEYVYVVPNSDVVRVPDSVTDEEALGVGCAFRSVVNGFEKLHEHGGIGTADCVVVQGSGPIGLYATVMAAQSGATTIIVIGAPDLRLALAKEWGATHTINIEQVTDPKERQKQVLDITKGHGAQVVIEAAGVAAAFAEGIDLLARNGTYLLLGQTSTQTIEFLPSAIWAKQAVVLGCGLADINHYYKALKFVERYRDKYPLDKIITRSYSLEEIDLALDNMKKGLDIKGVIDNRKRNSV